MIEKTNVVIIGGGIQGASIAYNLTDMDISDVVLLEKGELGSGSTGKTSAVIRQHYSNEVTIKMSMKSRIIFENFLEEVGERVKFVKTGLLICVPEEEIKNLEGNVSLQRSLGLDVDVITPGEASRLQPGINVNESMGFAFEQSAGYSEPYELIQAYIKRAKENGARIITNTPVKGIKTRDGSVKSVVTDRFEVETKVVVNAAGPWTRDVGRMVGVELPIEPVSLKVGIFQPTVRYDENRPVVLDMPNGVYFRPETGGLVLAGGGKEEEESINPDDYDDGVSFDYISDLSEKMIQRVFLFKDAGYVRGWTGIDGAPPDWHPILGEVPGLEGFICAAGFSGHGFKLAPVVGRLISELIVDGKTSTLDISPLSVERFKTGELLGSRYVTLKYVG
ncbi:MAG: FAD-dependent oxidoreductase [Nitrososphaeria archaeon]|nr:FAD-dependent oxidoreductase [Nitrososphaeria archaeon]NIN53391.1 FAD-dependent oxidoreductase [Nitrososphaeria archaeon]NIQ33903.1 FAD-dependent oxidoreductase [Nitrososphaeria archaeon]